MNTHRRTQVMASLVVVASFSLAYNLFAEEQPSFSHVVNQNFDRWTANDRGVLTVERVNQLIERKDVRGVEAAALASIHAFQKKSGTGQAIRLENLTRTRAENPALRSDQAASGINVNYNYNGFLRHIQSAPRKLFAVERPSLDTVTQGKLGDCYFVSAVGALAHSDPDRILQMITQKPDRSFEVQFANGKHVTVPALTDAQLALSSNAGQQGVWLNVLEIAAGIVRRDEKTDQSPLDNIGAGGQSAFSIGLLTGHPTDRYRIRSKVGTDYPAPEEDKLDELAGRFGKLIRRGLDRHELICCSTGTWSVPPGIAKTHEYAILGLKDGHVDLWNPWGYKYNFQPKGKPNYQHGYYFEGGRCSMPLRDFVKVFGKVTIERNHTSNAPAEHLASRAPTPAADFQVRTVTPVR